MRGEQHAPPPRPPPPPPPPDCPRRGSNVPGFERCVAYRRAGVVHHRRGADGPADEDARAAAHDERLEVGQIARARDGRAQKLCRHRGPSLSRSVERRVPSVRPRADEAAGACRGGERSE
eukprot:scaffold85975_cov62-Phaeocystis_antarctica.AAC.6